MSRVPAPVDLDAERLAEQSYLDHAYTCLDAMSVRTGAAVADAAERAAGDWDATVAQIHLGRRLKSITSEAGPLCFGRIDEDHGAAWHIGRRHVEDGNGEPVVVDWRAPVAVPFYRATFSDTLGLRRRRRFILDSRQLVDLIEEDFEHPDSSALAAAGGLPDPLLAELGRARTGTMRDIVATIAGEQDRIIRAPLDVPVVVQGGPGTGKTAVGLHRAAFLLYEHRVQLEREGVLVLGPNRLFLSYISEVLPSLGEVAVVQTTLAGLVPEWPVRSEDPTGAGGSEGRSPDERGDRKGLSPAGGHADRGARREHTMGDCQARHRRAGRAGGGGARVWWSGRAPAVPVQAFCGENGRCDAFGSSRSAGRHRGCGAGPDFGPRSAEGTRQDLAGTFCNLGGASGSRQREPSAQWPPSGSSTRPSACSCARGGPDAVRRGWSEADLPLLDEAQSVLSDAPRRYGHVVVDEAQDLSAMAFRMVARRNLSGRSFTVLGDLAQATAPGSQQRWEDAFEALGMPQGARIEELTTGYRVPQQIMELANALLAATRPTLVGNWIGQEDERRSRAAPGRSSGTGRRGRTRGRPPTCDPPDHRRRGSRRDVRCRVRAAPTCRDSVCEARTVRCSTGEVSLLRPTEAKGLEFDAMIVVEPADFVVLGGGTGLLYIALTRAVAHLSVVYSKDLTPALLPAA